MVPRLTLTSLGSFFFGLFALFLHIGGCLNCSIRINHSPDYPHHQIRFQSVATCHSRELKGILTVAAFHSDRVLLPKGLLPNISVDILLSRSGTNVICLQSEQSFWVCRKLEQRVTEREEVSVCFRPEEWPNARFGLPALCSIWIELSDSVVIEAFEVFCSVILPHPQHNSEFVIQGAPFDWSRFNLCSSSLYNDYIWKHLLPTLITYDTNGPSPTKQLCCLQMTVLCTYKATLVLLLLTLKGVEM